MCQGSQGTGFTSIPIYCLEGNFDEMTIDGVRAMKMHCWHEMGQTYENIYHLSRDCWFILGPVG